MTSGSGSDSESEDALVLRILATEDYFELLGEPREATDKELSKAYKKMALRVHPDKCSHPQGEEAFKKVSAAFACLRDPQQRASYERFGAGGGQVGGFPGGGAVDPNELFQQMFAEMARQQQENGGGGGAASFASFGGSGASFSSNGQVTHPAQLIFPKFLVPYVRMVPTNVVVLGAAVLFFYSASMVFAFYSKRLQYVLPILFLAPSGIKKPAFLLVTGLGLAGFL